MKDLYTEQTTLDKSLAKVMVLQIRKRPSTDVAWKGISQEIKDHFVNTYQMTGLRSIRRFMTDDELTEVVQIHWLDEPAWNNAKTTDPIPQQNEQATDEYCAANNITQIKITELRRTNPDFPVTTVKTNAINGEWVVMPILELITKYPALANDILEIYPLLETLDQ